MIEESALQFDVTTAIDIILMIFLLISALAIVAMRHLFSIAMVSGVYSLLSAAFFVNLDAVDVAFTEAAVGAGMSVGVYPPRCRCCNGCCPFLCNFRHAKFC